MANLKDLKIRINSVKSTQKITRAMKVVSASKLRRARENAEAATPYASRMARVVSKLAANVVKESAPKLLVGNGKDKTHLLIVVSSDRGLCGGFNTNLIKAVNAQILRLQKQDKEIKILSIGKKGYELMKTDHQNKLIGKVFDISKKKFIPFADAAEQADTIINMFNNNEFDVCTIFYNKFLSAISYEVQTQQLIPLELQNKEDQASENLVYDYEPSESSILNNLLPTNIGVQIYNAFLENSASEHGARMSAMDNATRNAGEMIKKLTLVYNRTRQAAITTELIEIIAGAEAV
jgi:F-type H+-transporting ATPase subunit gamma